MAGTRIAPADEPCGGAVARLPDSMCVFGHRASSSVCLHPWILPFAVCFSMSAPPGQPFQTLGFHTSIDLARKQPHYTNVSQLAGHKRPSDYAPGDPPQPVKHAVPAHPQGNGNSAVTLHARPGHFTRPSVTPAPGRLVASEIRSVAAAAPSENQQPRIDCSVPGPSQDPLLSLKDPQYDLNPTLVANLASLGVSSIYPWQASCLLARGLLTGERHLVYTAPTGGGKSLVADVLMLKRIIENPSRKAILVLPYVALVQEKLKWLRRVVHDVEKYVPDCDDDQPSHRRWKKLQKSVRVTGFFGGSKTTASWADTDIAVCTIEKVYWILF